MNIIISGKQMDVTSALKDSIYEKFEKLDKYFQKEINVNVTLSVQKGSQIVEVTIPFSGGILRAEESTQDMYASIDKVIDVLERQIRKHKTKLQKRTKAGDTIRFENVSLSSDNEEESKVVKTKSFPIKPMDEEEAVLQMELLRHNFFVFINAQTEDVNVVYKRKDGDYGLIEPQY